MKKWTVLKEELEKAVAILGVVPTRNAVMCSEFIRLEKEEATAKASLSSDLFAQATVRGVNAYPFVDTLYLDRRLFEPFIMAGKDLQVKEYTFYQNENGRLVVKHGQRVAVYAKAKRVSGYGKIPSYKKARNIAISPKMADALLCACSCATSDPITPFLNCVYVIPSSDGLQMYATNGKLVFTTRISQREKMKSTIAFPLTLAGLCKSMDLKKLIWDEVSAMLISDDGYGKIWQAVKTDASKSFPIKSFQKMITRFDKPICSINLASLGKAADRLSSCLSSVTREDLLLTLKIIAGQPKLKITSGIFSTVFSESFSLMNVSKKDHIIEWPLAEVLPVLSYLKMEGAGHLYIDDSGRTMLASKNTNLIVAYKLQKEKR